MELAPSPGRADHPMGSLVGVADLCTVDTVNHLQLYPHTYLSTIVVAVVLAGAVCLSIVA